MSDAETRRIVAQELELQRKRDAFWAKLYRRFPLVAGHKELANRLMQKNMAKMADFGLDQEDEAIAFLGNEAEREIGRRNRRDAASAEARAMSGGQGGLEHGHGTDGSHTFDADDKRFDHDPREVSLGTEIRKRREARRKAQRSWEQSDQGDRRAEHNR